MFEIYVEIKIKKMRNLQYNIFIDSCTYPVLPKGLPNGDKVCRQTILEGPFIKGLPKVCHRLLKSAKRKFLLRSNNYLIISP